jgi:hypothetical protein
MQAYCQAGMFNELILFETIQAHYLEKIEQVSGPNLATMFKWHSEWAHNMMLECLVEKR